MIHQRSYDKVHSLNVATCLVIKSEGTKHRKHVVEAIPSFLKPLDVWKRPHDVLPYLSIFSTLFELLIDHPLQFSEQLTLSLIIKWPLAIFERKLQPLRRPGTIVFGPVLVAFLLHAFTDEFGPWQLHGFQLLGLHFLLDL